MHLLEVSQNNTSAACRPNQDHVQSEKVYKHRILVVFEDFSSTSDAFCISQIIIQVNLVLGHRIQTVYEMMKIQSCVVYFTHIILCLVNCLEPNDLQAFVFSSCLKMRTRSMCCQQKIINQVKFCHRILPVKPCSSLERKVKSCQGLHPKKNSFPVPNLVISLCEHFSEIYYPSV